MQCAGALGLSSARAMTFRPRPGYRRCAASGRSHANRNEPRNLASTGAARARVDGRRVPVGRRGSRISSCMDRATTGSTNGRALRNSGGQAGCAGPPVAPIHGRSPAMCTNGWSKIVASSRRCGKSLRTGLDHVLSQWRERVEDSLYRAQRDVNPQASEPSVRATGTVW